MESRFVNSRIGTESDTYHKNAFNPLFPATVREVVMSGLYNNKNMFRRISRQGQQQCIDAMKVMRIEDIANKRIGQLSGGQQQRVFWLVR